MSEDNSNTDFSDEYSSSTKDIFITPPASDKDNEHYTEQSKNFEEENRSLKYLFLFEIFITDVDLS